MGSNKPRTCLHCGETKYTKARGLCYSCWKVPEVRVLYDMIVDNVGEEFGCRQPKLQPEPTEELPGSEGKIEELCRRLEKGQHLWHPKDA